jgi:hypothetical protein
LTGKGCGGGQVGIAALLVDGAVAVACLNALDARILDISQGEVPRQVMADPEGDECCILTPVDGQRARRPSGGNRRVTR